MPDVRQSTTLIFIFLKVILVTFSKENMKPENKECEQQTIYMNQVCPKYTNKSKTEGNFAAATTETADSLPCYSTNSPPAVTILQHSHPHATTLFSLVSSLSSTFPLCPGFPSGFLFTASYIVTVFLIAIFVKVFYLPTDAQ